jgi:hypothetical protein
MRMVRMLGRMFGLAGTPRALGPGESAVVARGDVQDAYGNFNGIQAGPIG